MILESIPAISDLSAEERYILANELWEQVAEDEASIPFDSAVRTLLEARRKESESDPESVISWEDAKRQLAQR